MSASHRLAARPCGRRGKWVVLVLWVVLLAAAGPLAGKLTSVQNNETASWLPGKAESTQVFALQERFRSTDRIPALVVYERPSGITDADRAAAAEDIKAFARIKDVAGPLPDAIPSADGKALQVIVPIAMDPATGWEMLGETVKAMRAVTDSHPAGPEVHVTGPAGISGDLADAFGGIDSTLLYAALTVVIVLLLLIYRSPVLWLLPVLSAVVALGSAQAVVYLLARYADLTVNAQSAGILTVLVFGAGTDYALLLVARYREELRRHEDRHEAMAYALHRAGPAIIASAATVGLGMLCLLAAEMNSTAGLGPVAAAGIVVGLLAMITLLPALLVITGRWVFWPAKPQQGSAEPSENGPWARTGKGIARRPRTVWVVTALLLGTMALGLTSLNANGLSNKDAFTKTPESITGMEVLGRHFPAGLGDPIVVISKAGAATQVRDRMAATQGIVEVSQPVVKDGYAYVEGTLRDAPDSEAAKKTVERVRDAVHGIAGADTKTGGTSAILLDTGQASQRDNLVIIPLVLIVVFAILAALLRAVIAPLVLIATVALSFAAALGVSSLVFEHVFGFAGSDAAFPLFIFVFLVALGIDYNIFLMTRVREEAEQHGSRKGAVVGLAATGGVITSAGLVLAGTFAVMTALPMVFLVEMGFAIAFGVLLDTIVVRAVLVTALNLDLGRWMWWPSALFKSDGGPKEAEPETTEPVLVS